MCNEKDEDKHSVCNHLCFVEVSGLFLPVSPCQPVPHLWGPVQFTHHPIDGRFDEEVCCCITQSRQVKVAKMKRQL